MKFPRSARIFRGHLDIAPFASVFFLLIIFVMLGALIYTPGVPVALDSDPNRPAIDLPRAGGGTNLLTGTDAPTVAVAVDKAGRMFFENQPVEEAELRASLQNAVRKSAAPLTLLVQADKEVAYDRLMRLTLLAREAGIRDALFATLPEIFPARTPTPPSTP